MSDPLVQPPAEDAQLQSDLITQIQEHTTALCAHFFNFTGALQRDAPPVGLDSDAPPVQPPPTAAQLDTVSKIPQMAEQILDTHKQIEALIARLPDVSDGERAQLERIVVLQHQNEAASEALQRELAAAKAQLRDTQELYAVLADDVLKKRATRRPLQIVH